MANRNLHLIGSLFVWVAISTFAIAALAWWSGKAFSFAPAAQQATQTISFKLRDHDGRLTNAEDWSGKWLLVFFGFTQCADICPNSLFKLSEVINQLDEDAKRIQILMITVDPAQDTPETLKRYVTHFHPSITGLTGTRRQIEDAAATFRVYYDDKSSGAGKDLVHSAFFYLINPAREFAAMYADSTSAGAITSDVKNRL